MLLQITITPFNMKEELEEGHFDAQGHYHWKKEKEVRDGWLDNIDWVKVKGRPENKNKVHKDDGMKGLGDESSSEDDEPEETFELMANYKEIFQHMKPKETIAKTLQRLGKFLSMINFSFPFCQSLRNIRNFVHEEVFAHKLQHRAATC